MICLWASVSSSDHCGQRVLGCGACVSTADVSICSPGPWDQWGAVEGKGHCPKYSGRRGQQRWAGLLTSCWDRGFHGLCSGRGTGAALCIWREGILPGPPLRLLAASEEDSRARGSLCSSPLPLHKSRFPSSHSFRALARCQGWTGPWAPVMARCRAHQWSWRCTDE